MSTSVLVLNYNGESFIKTCLDSVLAQTAPIAEIVVVDNGSTDQSLQMVLDSYPSVEVIESKENLGFAGGMNLGIDNTAGDALLLLNPDVNLEPDFLARILPELESDESVGSATGKVYRLADKKAKTIDTTGHIIFRNRLFADRGEEEQDVGQYDSVEEVFGACAGVGIFKREMLEDVRVEGEYFDESFFLFLEDTDLNWRAQLRGWKCLYVPTAVAWHWRGGTAERRTRLVEVNNYKNRYMMLIKNDSGLSALKNIHHFIATDTLKSLALLRRYPGALLGWIDVWRNFPALIRKRRIIQRNRTVTQAEFERWLAPFSYRQWIRKHLRGP